MSAFLAKTIDLRSLLEILGFLVTLWSLWRTQTAKEALLLERQKRVRQRALEDFNHIAFCAKTLEGKARLKDLERLAELSLELKGELAMARGQWARLITTEESANLEAAIARIDQLRQAIPQQEEVLDLAAIQSMSAVCDYVLACFKCNCRKA